MGKKNKEILKLRSHQSWLKKEIKELKIKVPKNAVVYVLMVSLFIYFFDKIS